MPQLEKGGKHVFGWSVVGRDGRVRIPAEALREYRLRAGERVILVSGSRTSGGFGLTRRSFLVRSPLRRLLQENPRLDRYRLREGEPLRHRWRFLCWLKIRRGGIVRLPPAARAAYGLRGGDRLMSVRSSDIAIGFAAKGPLVAVGREHPEIEVFI